MATHSGEHASTFLRFLITRRKISSGHCTFPSARTVINFREWNFHETSRFSGDRTTIRRWLVFRIYFNDHGRMSELFHADRRIFWRSSNENVSTSFRYVEWSEECLGNARVYNLKMKDGKNSSNVLLRDSFRDDFLFAYVFSTVVGMHPIRFCFTIILFFFIENQFEFLARRDLNLFLNRI